ncbi:ABC transporter ATP-binding protein [Alteribacter populi]|uniref:ABC transporter ATP-binding protein n=1 Tax=Alteribacter populi TaxID=2011011 RepID=UPI0012FDEA09|nr:ABC transporter ATP-binding protein [Alteribacter populi]
MIRALNLSTGYDKKRIINNLSFHVAEGELFGVLGPNGSGKTTLLKALTRSLDVKEGQIYIAGKELGHFEVKDLAKVVTLLPQHQEHSFSFTVKEVVAMGRYPHKKGLFHFYNEEDESLIDEMMTLMDVKGFANQSLNTLSGGEQQRVFLARALVQQPKLLLLDEPTNHLDISYQMELMNRIKNLSKEKGLTVLSILHDINLASLFCDRVLLLHDGREVKTGAPGEVLIPARLSNVYQTPLIETAHPTIPKPLITYEPIENSVDEVPFLEYKETEDALLILSKHPLRTLTTSNKERPFRWVREFIFYNEKHKTTNSFSTEKLRYPFSCPDEHQYEIIDKQTAGFCVVLLEEKLKRQCIAAAIFIDGHLYDGEMLDLMMKVHTIFESVSVNSQLPREISISVRANVSEWHGDQELLDWIFSNEQERLTRSLEGEEKSEDLYEKRR